MKTSKISNPQYYQVLGRIKGEGKTPENLSDEELKEQYNATPETIGQLRNPDINDLSPSDRLKTPYFYDEYKIFWVWDKENYRYIMCDDVHLLNLYKEETGKDIINSKSRQEVKNLLMQEGRKNKPQSTPSNWLQFKDMIVNLETGEQIKATPQYFITNPIPHKIGKSDKTPIIDKLLREWLVKEGVQDESYIETAYDIITYCCFPSQFLQRIIALTGGGSNGKDTFNKLITNFIGKENITATNIKALSIRFETSSLYKKLVCFLGETDSYDLANTNLIKGLVGETLLRFEFKGKNNFSDYPTTTPIISTNALPITPDKSDGFYRRWLIVDFPNQFPITRDLLNKRIPPEEYENLAYKVIKRAIKLYNSDNFTNGGTIEERARRYEERSHPLIQFIVERCLEGESFIKQREFTETLNTYLKSKNLKPINIHQVGKLLRNEGYEIQSRTYQDGSKHKSVIGLGWKEDKPLKQIKLTTTQTTNILPTLSIPICSKCNTDKDVLLIDNNKPLCIRCK